MSSSPIPIFDPQGILRDVPPDQLATAVKAGGMPAVKFLAPDKSTRYVPANRTQEAAAAGGQIQPYEEQDVKHPGLWHALLDDLSGIPAGLTQAIATGLPSSMPQPINPGVPAALSNMETEEKEGHGPLYRGTALAATAAGANVPGMEQSAREGDVAGVAGHALAVPAVMAATEGIARGAGPALDAARPALEAVRPAAATALRSAADVVSPDVTGIFSPRLAHAQRLAGKIADALAVPEKEFVNPGAPYPKAPPAEVTQARGLATGGQPAVEPSEALGKLPATGAAPEPKPTYPGAPLPAAPPAEVGMAKGLATGAVTPPKPQAAALADLPAPAVHQAAQELGPEATVAEVTDRANEISGNTIPRTISGDSALRQILTGQDNANLMKIAKSRSINVTPEAQLKPGVADNRLINKIINDYSPEELDDLRDNYLENTRMGKHDFGEIGPEAWKTMGLQTYFPEVKVPLAVQLRTAKAIENAGAAKFAPVGDLGKAIKEAAAPAPAAPASSQSATAATASPAGSEMGTFADNEGGTIYHGTGQPARKIGKTDVTYLSADPAEAEPFARGEIPGTGGGKNPTILKFKAEPGVTHNIDELISDDFENGEGDPDKVIANYKHDHPDVRYVTFTHPSSVSGEGPGFKAVVSLHPTEDLGRIGTQKLPPKAPGGIGDDLTSILQKSVEQAKAAKTAPASSVTVPEGEQSRPFVSPESSTTYGQQNKFVTADDAAQARANLKDKMFRSNAGFDPTMIADAAKLGAYHLEAGVREFGAWSQKMVDELGEQVRPHLQAIWSQVSGEEAPNAPTFYSKAAQVVNEKVGGAGSGDQILATLRNNGVKENEIGWTGLDDFLKGKPKVSKADVQQFINDNQIQLEETTKGYRNEQTADQWAMEEYDKPYAQLDAAGQAWVDAMRSHENNLPSSKPKYEAYTLPGDKQNYTEMLMKLPQSKGLPSELDPEIRQLSHWPENHTLARNPADQARLTALNQEWEQRANQTIDKTFNSAHFDEPNILAHVRFDDRVAADGKPTLFLEEVQSDWHQQGKKLGYQQNPMTGKITQQPNGQWRIEWPNGTFSGGYGTEDAATRAMPERATSNAKSGVPNAPFKSDWHELAMKRMLRYAAENGYDRLAWTTGEQQAARYDLSKQVSSIAYSGSNFKAFDLDGNEVISKTGVTKEELPDLIGKDAAQKLLAKEPQGTLRTLEGLDLKTGGEWAQALYDRAIPNFLNKYTKKWGAKVTDTTIKGEPEVFGPLHIRSNGSRYWVGSDTHGAVSPMFDTPMKAMDARDQMMTGPKVHSLDITPAMKKSVLKEGQPISKNQGLMEEAEPVSA